MTRRKHPETRTQRARNPDVIPAHVRKLGYEPADVPAPSVARAFGWLLAALLVACAAIAGMMILIARADSRPPPIGLVVDRLPPPPPRLEIDPRAHRLRIENEAHARLDAFGWADRQAGVARVPIETAMRIVAARGWAEPEPAPSPAETARAHAEHRQ